jgi:hypothetical protein
MPGPSSSFPNRRRASIRSPALVACSIPGRPRRSSQAPPLGSSPSPRTPAAVSFDPRHPARASFAILPVSTDGRATLAARFGSDRQPSAHLVLDVSGYFAPTTSPPPLALRFDSPLCPTFCIFPAGIPLALHYQIAGSPTAYRYDWSGTGAFSQTTSTPLPSFTFAVPGYYGPRLQVAAGSAPPSTVSFTPAILATTPVSSAAPAAPFGVPAVSICQRGMRI